MERKIYITKIEDGLTLHDMVYEAAQLAFEEDKEGYNDFDQYFYDNSDLFEDAIKEEHVIEVEDGADLKKWYEEHGWTLGADKEWLLDNVPFDTIYEVLVDILPLDQYEDGIFMTPTRINDNIVFYLDDHEEEEFEENTKANLTEDVDKTKQVEEYLNRTNARRTLEFIDKLTNLIKEWSEFEMYHDAPINLLQQEVIGEIADNEAIPLSLDEWYYELTIYRDAMKSALDKMFTK